MFAYIADTVIRRSKVLSSPRASNRGPSTSTRSKSKWSRIERQVKPASGPSVPRPYPFADEQAHSVSPLPVGINRQRFPDEDSERSSKVHKEDIDEYSSSTKLNREDHIVSG